MHKRDKRTYQFEECQCMSGHSYPTDWGLQRTAVAVLHAQLTVADNPACVVPGKRRQQASREASYLQLLHDSIFDMGVLFCLLLAHFQLLDNHMSANARKVVVNHTTACHIHNTCNS